MPILPVCYDGLFFGYIIATNSAGHNTAIWKTMKKY